ncbi:MAG: STAS domain-containing protein [Aggregatilineales bacterium]
METSITLQQGICIVNLSGRFDSFHVNTVRSTLAETRDQSVHVIVNLGVVNFMDSSAVAVLVNEMKHTRQHGGDVRLCELQPTVKVIFELTRLDKAFKIFTTEVEAFESFSL